MRVVFLGATRGMGRALARHMVDKGDQLHLLGRDPVELEKSAADLEIRGGEGPVRWSRCDLLEPSIAEGTPHLGTAQALLWRLDAEQLAEEVQTPVTVTVEVAQDLPQVEMGLATEAPAVEMHARGHLERALAYPPSAGPLPWRERRLPLPSWAVLSQTGTSPALSRLLLLY